MKLAPLCLLLACAGQPPRPTWTEPDALAARVDALTQRSRFAGVVLVGRGDDLAYFRPAGTARLDTNAPFEPDATWHWASVTKQLTAILVMQEVARGTIDLSAPIARYLPAFASPNASTITVEQLLRHQSGLPNPDDKGEDVPVHYRPDVPADPLQFCAGPVTGPAGGAWVYNNCDYVVAGAILEAVTKQSWAALFAERISTPTRTHARLANEADVIGWADGKREPPIAYARFGAAGALVGTVRDLWAIDRALVTGALLPEAARAKLWDGKAELGFMGLGQWVYEVELAGCARPVRIVERRGAIGGTGVRNFILPDNDLVVIAMTNRAELEAAFGELWMRSGFAYELLSIAACR